MTLRRQLIYMILLTVGLSVVLNTLISGNYIDTYFRGYIQTQYEHHVEKISDFASALLLSSEPVPAGVRQDLARYLDDPIIQIQILSADGRLLVGAGSDKPPMHDAMMRGRRFQAEIDSFELKQGDQVIGFLRILRQGAIQSSESVMLFKSALRIGGLISSGIVFVVAILFTTWVSRRLTKDLIKTADYASSIQTEDLPFQGYSKIQEINAIQMSLRDLSSKLRLQHDIQKEKADQLAHEARTPLTLLKTHVEGALDGVIDLDSARLESCLHQIDTLTKVLGSINQVITQKDEALKPVYEDFDLIADAKKIFKGMGHQFDQKNLHLELQAPEVLTLRSDRTLVSQIIYNLLTNAYKFTPSGGHVQLRLDKTAQDVRISVTDDGMGLDDTLLEEIFLPYYRDPKARQIPGEGLGLYIGRRNARALGGDLTAANAPGGGAQMTLILPLFAAAPGLNN